MDAWFVVFVWFVFCLGFLGGCWFNSDAYNRGYRDASRYWQHEGEEEKW